ncbi:MAG: TetR/AcrR family transcriptional regulator [Myxococcota bacterium]
MSSGPGNPRGATRRRRSADEARREILDAAQRRLDAGGPDAIRLQDIARDVGISHPTILHHFGSRNGLIGALDSRAIQTLTADVEQMLAEDGDDIAASDLVERVAQTMDQQGLARLIAWWAMRESEDRATGEIDPATLVGEVSRLVHARLGSLGVLAKETDDSLERVMFSVRLAVVAMFGDALIGDDMSQLEGSDREVERHRFRAWLAQLLLDDFARERPDER